MGDIIFYEENREGFHSSGPPPKYIKYKIPTGEKSQESSMGYDGQTIIISLSNGKIIITNDLWELSSTDILPDGALIGTIYNSRNGRLFGNTVDCYIYSKKDKKRITKGNFNVTHGLHLHEKGTNW